MKTTDKNSKNGSLDMLVTKLKTEDSNYANISKVIQIVYWIFIPVYALLAVLEYTETQNINEIISGSFFIVAFLIFAVFFRKYYKEYKYVDYSQPTVQMLKKAAYRYQPFQKKSVWILFALVLIDAGLTFDWIENASVIIIQAVYVSIILIAVVIGLILWYFKYKPIRDEALKLIAEIEGN